MIIPIFRIYLLLGIEPFTNLEVYFRYYPYYSIIDKTIDPTRELMIRLEAKEP